MELEQIEQSSQNTTTVNNEDGQTMMDDHKGGGRTTLPFILGATAGLSLASSGWTANLIVFLISEFNVKNITAFQINNVILGCNTLFPIAGAIVADTFFDSFTVVTTFSFVSLLLALLFGFGRIYHRT
ncbi:putative protein NRT1/ PTR FAMILY 2.2 [Durio zibethinus]|uniref:Protein NRT1/ PTR FAMILY 2.3-like n=1 Tax=Durio zibethinus TaxID=66656 RepID=A0A6P6AHL0_DURZI|nr:putative protein NRT1/ PTR FAMILY 2.2 [Durio zibethinus]